MWFDDTPRSIKLPVKHTLTLPPSYLRIHSFIVTLMFSLYLFYRYALWNLAILATETNKCDLIWFDTSYSVVELQISSPLPRKQHVGPMVLSSAKFPIKQADGPRNPCSVL